MLQCKTGNRIKFGLKHTGSLTGTTLRAEQNFAQKISADQLAELKQT
jgi:hypothetical protein